MTESNENTPFSLRAEIELLHTWQQNILQAKDSMKVIAQRKFTKQM
jgi:hypothetical protein